jgi:hypothetical protein
MSLKYFHIFFIVIATLLAFFFGFWSLQNYYAGETVYLAYAVASFLTATALITYGRRVWNKLKGIGFFAAALLFVKLDPVLACSTCYGDPNSPTSHALVASVLVLLGFITAVLIAFLALIFHYNKRSRDLNHLRG